MNLVSLSLLASVQVSGSASCPAPADVARALAAIGANDPVNAAALPVGTAAIEAGPDGGAVVRFLSAEGRVLDERPLPGELSCPARAQAAAVIVAARFARLPTLAPVEATPSEIASTAEAEAPAAVSARPFSLEAALLGALAGTSPTAGIRAGGAYPWSDDHTFRFGVGYLFPHRADLANGTASWSRWMGALGYARRLPLGDAVRVEGEVEALATVVRLAGEGYRSNEQHSVFHPGVSLGLRLSPARPSGLRFWAGAGAVFWPRGQRLILRDSSETSAIPRFELVLAVGAAWGPG